MFPRLLRIHFLNVASYTLFRLFRGLKIPVRKVQASCGRGNLYSELRPQDACFVQTGIFNPWRPRRAFSNTWSLLITLCSTQRPQTELRGFSTVFCSAWGHWVCRCFSQAAGLPRLPCLEPRLRICPLSPSYRPRVSRLPRLLPCRAK